MWWHVSVSCFNSFVFINEDHRFLQSRMLSTFRHTHGSYSNMFCPPASTTDRSFSRKALSLTSQAWNYNSQQPRPTLSLLYLLLPCREHQNQYSHGLRPRGGICPSRQCRQQCKIFASGVNFSIFTHFLRFFLLKLLKLGEIDGVKFLA